MPKTTIRNLLSSICVLTIVAISATAFAQEDKKEIQIKETKVKQTKREKVEAKTSPKDIFVIEKKIASVKKLDETIVRLKRLIDKARKDNPDRAGFLFGLAEAYWSKSKSYEQKTFQKQDECFQLADQGEKGRAQACKSDMAAYLKESKKLREDSVELYVDIIRNYPQFKDLDQVYYYLGANLMEVGKREEALDIFRRLIADYPKSKFVPNVLLAFGDYYFDKDDMASALKAYKRVRKYPKSSVYAYARYKEGWCYFNVEKKEKALDTFLETLKLAKKNPKLSTSSGLIKQVRKDIVLTYSYFGAPDKAVRFFTDVSSDKDEMLNMSERLAILYADKGRPEASTRLFNELIRINKSSIRVIRYQKEIVRNTTQQDSYSSDSVKSLVRLAKLVKAADDGAFKDLKKAEWAKERTSTEEMLRAWATTYHREAQKTKNANLYASAYFLYKAYFIPFTGNSPKTYEMNFFYGELLYKLQRWNEAADAYEQVVTLQPKGQYTNESVHGLVLSLFKVVSVSEEQADLNKAQEDILKSTKKDKDGKTVEAKKKPIPKPKAIPADHQKLIKACKMYAELNPKGERIVDVKYTMARIYYDYNHIEDAIGAFHNIAYSHPEHRLAVIAANLELDSYVVLQQYDKLHTTVKGYLKDQPIKDEPFLADLRKLDGNVSYKKCDVAQTAENWKETSTCFVEFFRQFPDHELVDAALYSAALAFERQRQLGKAIQVRIFLLKARPDSEFAPKSLYDIGGNYHALAVYSEAAKFYELYQKSYPKRENAETALSNAATFRHGLGDLDKAVDNFETYLKSYGARDPARSADVYFKIGEIYEQQNKEKKAFDQYNNYIRKFGRKASPDRYMQSHIKIAKYYEKRNKKKADAWYKKTLKEFGKFAKPAQKEMREGRDSAAEAKFMQGERVFQEMAKIKINSPNEKKLKKALEEKKKGLARAEGIFKEVIGYSRPDWSIAAFYRIGSGYQNAANSIRKSFIPKRLTYDQKEIYRGMLEDAASGTEDLAVAAFEGALLIAREKSWFNKFSKNAENSLAQLRPKKYRKPSELRSQPTHLNDGFSGASFIKSVEDEDRLTDFNAAGPSEPQSQR